MKPQSTPFLLRFQESPVAADRPSAWITTKTAEHEKEQPDRAQLGTMTKTKILGEGPDEDPFFFLCFVIPRKGKR